jgi:hypothetical protein
MRKVLIGFLLFILLGAIVFYVLALNSNHEMGLAPHIIFPFIFIVVLGIIYVLRKVKM